MSRSLASVIRLPPASATGRCIPGQSRCLSDRDWRRGQSVRVLITAIMTVAVIATVTGPRAGPMHWQARTPGLRLQVLFGFNRVFRTHWHRVSQRLRVRLSSLSRRPPSPTGRALPGPGERLVTSTARAGRRLPAGARLRAGSGGHTNHSQAAQAGRRSLSVPAPRGLPD